MTQENQFISTKLNLDQHYALLGERDLVYLLNGDIQGKEGNVDSFVQNAPSNELCLDLSGYTMVGPGIPLNNHEHVLFLNDEENVGWIMLANLDTCSMQVWASGECLAFDPDYPVRGVYKHNNKDNDRRVYFIDGKNYNRYADIDKPFPQNTPDSICDTCDVSYDGTLNCDALRINREMEFPCLTLTANQYGQLPSGVYQLAFAYSQDGVKYSDFYFSDILKVHSNKNNIGFQADIECVDTLFDQFKVLLVTNTRESSLVVYDLGVYSSTTDSITINNLANATILSLEQALEKRVVYDKSQHIVSNGETLLLGKHENVDPLDYQPYANNINLYWAEGKVPKKDAHKYPSQMRDEVYAYAIEWFDEYGQSRGRFHIPGQENEDFSIDFSGNTYVEQDYAPVGAYTYEKDQDCRDKPLKVWQVENTATILGDFTGTCELCEEVPSFSKYGKMGYYECESLTYPNDPDTWGDLACQPIRHHKMPSHNLSHIHNGADCFTSITEATEYDEDGNGVTIADYHIEYVEEDCVNVLGVVANNIAYPKDSNGNDITNWHYRILYAKRDGNKSVLHKGLVFNTFQEILNPGANQEYVYYPNYPYNDLKADVFISKSQTSNQKTTPAEGYDPQGYISAHKFTYHSPNIHYQESKDEFGSEVKLYTEEIGKIKGDYNPVYLHPTTKIDASTPNQKSFWSYARQFDSVCNYSEYEAVDLPFVSRRQVENSQYLLPIRQFVENTTRFNNEYREPSYFLSIPSTDDAIPNPTNKDTSRVLISELACQTSMNYCDSISRNGIDYDIQGVSYYVGVKTPQWNQYGSLEQIEYVPITHCLRQTNGYTGLDLTNQFWGGDIYITRHSVARKMPLFLEWLDDVPFDEAEYNYRDKRNVYYPRFWYDSLSEANDQYRFDCLANATDHVTGYFYIWINGILNFWCESEYIGDFREEDQTPNSRYFPTTSPKELFRADTIKDQPTFLYNLALLGTDIDTKKQILNLTQSDADFTVIFSLKADAQSAGDNWLNFLPLNYTILPRIYGEFTGMHYTDQYSILFAFENMMMYSQEDYTQTTNEGNTLFLSQGDIFSRRLRKMSNEDTGYTGCVDPFSFCNTRFGTIYFDRYRKLWFLWSGKLNAIEDNQAWLTQYTSNANPGYSGSIITMYDNYSKNLYMTDKETGWTLSYKFGLGYNSFHSFVPGWYIGMGNNFLTAPSDLSSLWKHNVQFDYQSYYGTVHPFDIGFVVKGTDQTLQSFNIFSDWMQYENWGEPKYKHDKFFDTLLVYNDRTSTGIIPLFLKDSNDPNQSLVQNKDQYMAEVTQVLSNIYRVNKLEDTQVASPNIQFNPNGWQYSTQNLGVKPPYERGGIRGKWFIVHLASTQQAHKIITQLNIAQSIQNYK